MVNGLAVLGWGVGGIEAEAAMLGQPISMLIPEVIGFRFTGALREGVTATDLVLTVTQMLRKKGVVGKFVDIPATAQLAVAAEDRATMANMAPEYGATCGFFPADKDTINYLRSSGRDPHRVALVEAYAKAQGMWRGAGSRGPRFYIRPRTRSLDRRAEPRGPPPPAGSRAACPRGGRLRRCVGGHAEHDARRPGGEYGQRRRRRCRATRKIRRGGGRSTRIADGHVVIAAITSCTNTSNPNVLIAAGLLARKANEKGLKPKPWVKTSLAPGSQVVTDYLTKSGLQSDLDALGFNLAGYGCTTCIGNSGPLPAPVSKAILENDCHRGGRSSPATAI